MNRKVKILTNLNLALFLAICFASVVAFGAPKVKPTKVSDQKKQAAMVFFEEPQDGATVPAKFTIKMGLMGYNLKPAGDMNPQTGHHHVLVDMEPTPKGEAIPMGSPKHIHFGKGQTEAEVELPSGKHTLVLQFADGNHVSFGPDMSAKITVTVEEPKKK